MPMLALFTLAAALRLHDTTCEDEAHRLLFLHEDPNRNRITDVALVKERAIDFCAWKETTEMKYFCAYFGDFVEDAFSHRLQKTEVTVKNFCALVKDHAARMENEVYGVQALRLGETIGDNDCVTEVHEAMSPDGFVAKADLPDFWYLYCMHHHECTTVIPARTRDCTSSHVPHTSKNTCELLRSDAVELTRVKPQDTYSAENVCGWFTGFSAQQAQRLEAYAYVMYGEEAEHSLIPTKSQSDHALVWSRLSNGAQSHWIRDHSAHEVTWSFAAAMPALAVFATLLA